MTTAYTNNGGTGDRRLLITPSYASGLGGSPTDVLEPTTDGIILTNSADFTGKWIKFAFDVPVVIDEAKWYQDTSTSTITGKWQGSNNNSDWTDIGSPFVIGGTSPQTQTELNGNTTAYSYYRILGTAGTCDGTTVGQIEFKIAPVTSVSYLNALGSGDRTALITATSSGGALFGGGVAANLLNGYYILHGDETYFGNVTVTDLYLKFDFGTAVVMTEAKWIQAYSGSQGSWKWQGSNNNSTWTDIGVAFTLGSSSQQTLTQLNGNAINYRYYQLVGVSGTATSGPDLFQILFQIGTVSLSTPTVTTQAVSSITATTATGNGTITSSGGATITEVGTCVSVSNASPTKSDTYFTGTTVQSGAFTASMTGLSKNTTYHYSTYAINSEGTTYTNGSDFKTNAGDVVDLGAPFQAAENVGGKVMFQSSNGDLHMVASINGNSTHFTMVHRNITQETTYVVDSPSNTFGGLPLSAFALLNDKLYLGGTGAVLAYDLAGNISEVASIPNHLVVSTCLGQDYMLYIGTSATGPKLFQYNPAAETLTDMGIISTPTTYCYTYSIVCDGTYAYCAIRSIDPDEFYLCIVKLSDYSKTWVNNGNGDTGAEVLPMTDSTLQYTRTDSLGAKTYYGLAGGVATLQSPKTRYDNREYSQSLYKLCLAASGNDGEWVSGFNYDWSWDEFTPWSGRETCTMLYRTPSGSGSYTSISASVSSSAMYDIRPFRILPISEDPGVVLALGIDYLPIAKFNYTTGEIDTYLGYNMASNYFLLKAPTGYFIGGYSDTIECYDPSLSWNLTSGNFNVGGFLPDDSNRTNPYKIKMYGANWNYWLTYDNNGFVWSGFVDRDTPYNGISWYDPSNGDTGEDRSYIGTFNVRSLVAANNRTKICFAGSDGTVSKIFVFDAATQTGERTVTVDLSFSGEIVMAESPGTDVYFVKTDGNTNNKFCKVDISTGDVTTLSTMPGIPFGSGYYGGRSRQDRRLVWGPDGYMYLFIATVLYKVDTSGTFTAVQDLGFYGMITFVGGDLLINNINNSNSLKVIYDFLPIPTVTTQDASSITNTTAVGNGNITDNGGGTIDDYGVVISTYNTFPTHGEVGCTYIQAGTDDHSGAFTVNLSSLTKGQLYYINTCAHNETGWSNGTAKNFTTANAAIIYTGRCTDATPTQDFTVQSIGGTTALAWGCLNGVSTDDAITEMGVCWGESQDPGVGDNKVVTTLRSDWPRWGYNNWCNFSTELTGLTPSHSDYHYRAFITVAGTTFYGEDKTFSTVATPAQRTLYVDPNNVSTTASDSNNGTSLSTAWATLNYALSQLGPGDTLNIRASHISLGHNRIGPAGSYALASGTKERPIVIQGYGNEAVTITGLVDISSSWTFDSGAIYHKTITDLPGPNGCKQVSEDSLPMAAMMPGGQFYSGNGLSDLTGPGQYSMVAHATSVDIYVWCSDGADPSTHLMEMQYWTATVELANAQNYVFFKNLAIEGGYWPISLTTSYCQFTGSDFAHGVKFRNYAGMVKVQGEVPPSAGANFFNPEHNIFNNCEFYNHRDVAIDNTGGDYTRITNCYFHDQVSTSANVIMMKDSAVGVVVDSNYIKGINSAAGNPGPVFYIGGQSFTSNGVNGQAIEAVDCVVSNNVINNCNMGSAAWFMAATNCKYVNNTHYNCAFYFGIIGHMSSQSGNFDLGYAPKDNVCKNNLFWSCSSATGHFFSDDNAPLNGWVSDYNLVGSNATLDYYIGSLGGHHTWTYVRGLTPALEVHSLISTDGTTYDPKFANGSGTFSLATDFELKPESPAINAGGDVSTLGVTTDYLGNVRPQ